ncbi:hypothetical protein [Bacillus phage vB_BanS-Thrax5]|nr:hypothetical protein [Bacillus phage vB_BanS-Thrax5]
MDNIGKRPSLKPPTPPQGKSGWQDKMKKFMDKTNRNSLEGTIASITALYEENERLKQRLIDYSKDEELQKLQEELSNLRMNSLHIFTEDEITKKKEFAKLHYQTCKGSVRYIVTGTGIGTHTLIECCTCKKQEDITDYKGW